MSQIGNTKVLLTTVGTMIKFTTISNLAVIKLVMVVVLVLVMVASVRIMFIINFSANKMFEKSFDSVV